MDFIDNTKFKIDVIKTQLYFENSVSGFSSNIFKVDFSDDEIDYDLNLSDDIYNLQFSDPITNTPVLNSIKYNLDVPLLRATPNNFKFDLNNESQQIHKVSIQLIDGEEPKGFIVENFYTDFIHTINSGKVYDYDEKEISSPIISSDIKQVFEQKNYQAVGNTFSIIITNNKNIDLNFITLNIYSITYRDLYTSLIINFI